MNGKTHRDPATGVSTITERSGFVSAQSNRTGELTEILEVRTPAGFEFTYPSQGKIELFIPTHEQFTTDGTAANTETFTLSNKLVDSPSLRGSGGADGEDTTPPGAGQADVIVYEGGARVTPDAVRYDSHDTAPNEIDYSDDGTANTLDVYYVWGDSSLIEGRWYKANEEEYDQVFGSTAGEMHTASTLNVEESLTWNQTFTAGPKERVKFLINTAVDLTNWDAFKGSGAGPNSTDSFASFRLPVQKRKSHQGAPRRGDPRGPSR